MTTPQHADRTGGRDAPQGVKETVTKNKQTPASDMQADDAGTAESGTTDRASAVQGAMKQTSKTDAERNRG